MIDLHMHSTFSDGECSPEALLKMAQELHLRYLSITDHDNMDAYQNLCLDDFDGKLIYGVEMTFMFQGQCMDMLGYGVDPKKMETFHLFHHHTPKDILERENKRLAKMVQVSHQQGLRCSDSLVIQHVYERANDVICDDLLSYEENHVKIKQMGIVNRTTFYRNHYLNPNSVFYMAHENDAPDVEVVAKAIHDSGGLTFLAHPFVYDVPDTWKLIEALRLTGCFDGIECIHRRHLTSQSDALITYCQTHHLYQSGGSDFHKKEHLMGHGDRGKQPIPDTIALKWITHSYK